MSARQELDFATGLSIDAPEARSRVHAYASGPSGIHAVSPEEAVRAFRERCGPGVEEKTEEIIWLDIVSPGEAEAHFLRHDLGFHPLAVEDCVRGRQRPKVDRYSGYFFMVLYAARINPDRQRMALTELHVFVGERFVVTVHDQRVDVLTEVLARWRAAPGRLADTGALAHALLDNIVDEYFPVLDHFSERVEDVEEAMLTGTEEERMQSVLSLRRELTLFRKVVAPERDLLTRLLRRDLPFLRPELLPYFQDVHDHVMRVTEEIDSMRELLAAAVDAYLSAASNRLNQTMRVMAAWSIILMAMAWIAGVYGMNFDRMPELHWRLGYAWALGVMLGVGSVLFLYFRRQNWI
ncbi:MAG TPA: magnesium/cobalt transporter CorA [Longimicrobiaceae bacterium]|nr:magnesium/cobalt transporter CorA [Longimicrobiaceae bacterium]